MHRLVKIAYPDKPSIAIFHLFSFLGFSQALKLISNTNI